MLGLNLLVRLGRQVLSGPVTDSGLLPAGVYRHLVLAALEEEDFPEALRHLTWTGEPVMGQMVVLRLRLLAARHREQLKILEDLLAGDVPAGRREKYAALAAQEAEAVQLLARYEAQALEILAGWGRSGRDGR